METTKKIKIAITQGDINGIGYEIILKALSDPKITDIFTPVVYGSKKISAFYKKMFGLEQLNFNYIQDVKEAKNGKLNLIDVTDERIEVELGLSTKDGGLAAFQSLQAAVKDLKVGKVDALVTAPINKENIQSEEFKFPGHTEYLAEMDGKEALMFMVSEKIKVAVVTGHIPVKEVADKISTALIVQKLQIMHEALQKDFGVRKPKIAVLGLNPHAGDNGLIGEEDAQVILPAIESANQKGIFCFGPYPADGFFGNQQFLQFDAVLAMYHDQGLVPFKTIAFGEGTNFTAGLSFVRTSPDHGTAYDIAGKSVAEEGSLLKAIYAAIDIVKYRTWNGELDTHKIDPNISKHFYRRNS